MHLPISWWVIYGRTCPHYTKCSGVSEQKWHDPCARLSLLTWSHPTRLFFSLDGKSPQRKIFCWCESVETKNGRSPERYRNRQVQNLFWAVGNQLGRCAVWNGEWLMLRHVRTGNFLWTNFISGSPLIYTLLYKALAAWVGNFWGLIWSNPQNNLRSM